VKHAWLICMTSLAAPLAAPLAEAVAAQQPLTRAEAVAAAEAGGSRLALARADTAISASTLAQARMFENPTASGSYSKSTPQYHASLDLPLDFLWLRGARAASAREALAAARFRFGLERAAARFDADTAYTRALAAAAHARLSRQNAHDADSLLRMATIRRDAGDASDLDVQLATVSAGQAANTATDDSLAAIAAVLDLQAVIGLPADRVAVVPVDSLTLPPGMPAADSGLSLNVAAAEATLRSEERSIAVARRSVFAAPSVTVGFETGDPGGSEPGILPLVGFSVPLPLFNWNGAGVALATANRDRARVELALARRESGAARSRAIREQQAALARAVRDRGLLGSAERVASMSLTAYAEGAVPLANVLEARRAARDAVGQYVDDLAAANNAAAAVRLFTLTVPTP
jgi:outer membrane protein, heavy metal efflux system